MGVSKSNNRGNAVLTSGSGILTGGGMMNNLACKCRRGRRMKYCPRYCLGGFNKLSAVEQFYPFGNNHFNCAIGLGYGAKLTCYGVYCKLDGNNPTCTTRSRRVSRRAQSGTATLPSGYTMTGGGLYNKYRSWNSHSQFEESIPSGNNAWKADMGIGWGDFVVYVTGCKGIKCKTIVSGEGPSFTEAACPAGWTMTGCGIKNNYRIFGKQALFGHVVPEGNKCKCSMGA